MPTAAEGRRKFAARFVGNINLKESTDNNEIDNNIDNKEANYSSDHNSRKQGRRTRHKPKHHIATSESNTNLNDDTNKESSLAVITTNQQSHLGKESIPEKLFLVQQIPATHITSEQDVKSVETYNMVNSVDSCNKKVNAEDLHLDLSGLEHKKGIRQECVETLNKGNIHKTNNKQGVNKIKEEKLKFFTGDVNARNEHNTNMQNNSVKLECNTATEEKEKLNNYGDNFNVYSRQLSEEIMPSLMRSSQCSVSHGPIITEDWARSVIKPGEEFLLHDVRYPHAIRKNIASDTVGSIRGTKVNQRRQLYTARTAAYEHEMRCHEILYQAAEKEELALLREEQMEKEQELEELEFLERHSNVNTPRSSVRIFNEKYSSIKNDRNLRSGDSSNNINLRYKMHGQQLVESTHIAESANRKANKLYNKSRNSNVPRTSRLSQTEYVRSLLLSASTSKSTKHSASQSTIRQESRSLNRKSELVTTNNNSTNQKEVYTQKAAPMMATDDVECTSHTVPSVIEYTEEAKIKSNIDEQEGTKEYECTLEKDSKEYTADVHSAMPIKPFSSAPCISPRLTESTTVTMTIKNASQTDHITLIDSANKQNVEQLSKEKNDINNNNEWNSDEEKSLYSMQSYHYSDENRSSKTHHLPNIDKIEENEDKDINRIDNTVNHKFLYTKSQSTMSDDSRNVGQMITEQMARRSSELSVRPSHNLQMTNKADNTQVYSARQVRTRNTPVFFSRPAYDTTDTKSENKLNVANNIIDDKMTFTPRFQLHSLRNSSEESVTSLLPNTQKKMEPKELEEALLENVKSQNKVNNNYYTKNGDTGDNNEVCTSTAPQENVYSKAINKNADALTENVVVVEYTNDAKNINAAADTAETKTQESEMFETNAKETELLRRARSTLLFRYYNKNNDNKISSKNKTLFDISDGVMGRNINKSNKLLHLQQPPILASSILHVKAAGSSTQNKMWRSTQHSMEQREEEEFYRSANIDKNDTEKIMHDYKSNQQFIEEQLNQKSEMKRPHRPNIALTSVNDLQSTAHVVNVLSSNAIWNDVQEQAISFNNITKNAIDVMKVPESTINKSKDEQKEIKYTNKGAFSDSTQVLPTRHVEINEEIEEQSVSLDAALIEMIADPFFQITSDENHCRLLVLNAEYMARTELMQREYNNHVKNTNDKYLFVTEKTKSNVNNEGCSHYEQTEANTNVNSLFRAAREMEPWPRKPTARVLEITDEPIAHLNTSSSSTESETPLLSSHLPPQTVRLLNTSQQIQLAPSETAMSMERVKPSATITTPRPINLHKQNKIKNKQRKPKSSVDVHIAGATVVQSEKQEEQGATNIAQEDLNDNRFSASNSKKTAPINNIEFADAHKAKTNLHAPLESINVSDTRITKAPTDDQSKKDDYSNKGSSSSKIEESSSQKVEMENEHKLIKVADEMKSSESTKEIYVRSDAPVDLICSKEELQIQKVDGFKEEEQQSLQLQTPIDNKELLEHTISATEEIEKDATKSEDRADSTVGSTRSTMYNEAEISQITQEHYNNTSTELKEVLHDHSPEFNENSKRESSLSQQRSVSISSSSSQPPSPLSSKHNNLSEVKLIVNAIMPSEKTGPIHSLSTSNIGYKLSSTKISPKVITSQLAHQCIMHESVNCNVDDKSFICEEHDTANMNNHFNNENIMTYYTNEKHDSESEVHQYAIDNNDDHHDDDVTHNEQEHVYKDIVEEKEEVDVDVMESSSSEDKSSLIAPHVNVETFTEASLTNETNVEEENRVLPTLLEVSANDNDYSEQEIDNDVSDKGNEFVELAPDKSTVEAKGKETCLAQVSNEPCQLYSEPTSTDVTINDKTTINIHSNNRNDIYNKNNVLEIESLEKSREYQENKNEKSNIEVNAPNAATNLYNNVNDEHGSIVDDTYDNDSDENIIVQPKEVVCINNEIIEDQEDEDNIYKNNYSTENDILKNDTLHKTINIDTTEEEQPTSLSDHFQQEEEELKYKAEQEHIDQLREDKASEELFRQRQKYDQQHITNETKKNKLCDEAVRRLVSLLLPTGPVMSINEEESNDESTTIATNMKPTRFHDECMEEVKEFILSKYRTTHASSISSNAKDIIGASNVDDTRKNENSGINILNKKQSFSTANEMLPNYFQSRSAYIRKLRKELLLDNPNKLTPCASPKVKAPLAFNEIKELSQQASALPTSPTSSVTTTTTANSSTLASTDIGSQNVLLLTVDNDEVSETPVVTVEDEIDDPLDDGSYQQQNVQYVLDLFGNAMQSNNTFCEHTQVTSKELSPVNIALRHLFDPPTRSASTRVTDKSHEHKDITAALQEHAEQ